MNNLHNSIKICSGRVAATRLKLVSSIGLLFELVELKATW
jgi:hypothetical protein